MPQSPLVSVCIITYNHEEYIEEAVKGALNQKLHYPYEIVIGDDCSTDRTVEKCKKLKEANPEKCVRIVEQEKNLGMNGNWMATIQAAYGKYIAICEGDDYWIDSHKLQKQISFLEENEDYAMSSHEVYLENDFLPKGMLNATSNLYYNFKYNGIPQLWYMFKLLLKDTDQFWKRRRNYQGNKRYDIGNLETALNTAFDKRYIHTASIVARTKYLQNIPEEIFNYTIGHRLVVIWTALFGNQKHFKEIMAVRRVQESSAARTNREQRADSKKENFQQRVNMLQYMLDYCSNKKRNILKEKISEFKQKIKILDEKS